MEAVEFVYFDLDDTLLDHRTAERAALADLKAAIPQAAGVEATRFSDAYHRINVEVWKEYAAGRLTKAETRAVRFERLLRELSLDGADPEALGEEYLVRYSGYWAWLQGAREAFTLAADRLRVGIITNGFAEIQRAKLARFPELLDRSAAIVISEEVGFMKPDRRLFDHAARLSGTAPGRILYVGDAWHSDIEGGLAAGWRVAWYGGDPSRAPVSVPVLGAWGDLGPVLAG